MPESAAPTRRLTPLRASLLSALVLAIGAAVLFGRGTPSEAAPDTPKSVIILIGDGMGPAQRMASQLANYGYETTQPMGRAHAVSDQDDHALRRVRGGFGRGTAPEEDGGSDCKDEGGKQRGPKWGQAAGWSGGLGHAVTSTDGLLNNSSIES